MMIEPGIQFIGREQHDRQKPYWKSVGMFGMPIRVLWISPNVSRTQILIGHWKPWLNKRMNGYRKSGGQPMETHTAQGFLRLCLSEKEAQRIIHSAKRMGRYLIPLEVSRILKKDIKKSISDEQETNMHQTWLEFCKALNIDQRTGCTDPDVLGQWFDYVSKNYHEPLPESSPWDN